MELFLYKILLFYFLLGAIITFVVNKKKQQSIRRKNWLKYFTYLLLVNFIFISILFQPEYFQIVSGIIIIFGAIELIQNLRTHSGFFKLAYLIPFSVLAYFFFQFSQMERAILFYAFFLVTVFDGFSQLSGQLFGKTKLIPHISPNKTVEGLIGGMLFTIITSIFIKNTLQLTGNQSITIGLGIAISAFSGDILASYGKRKLDIKDYSQWIPGHGGFLDRFDSFLVVGSFVFLFIKYLSG